MILNFLSDLEETRNNSPQTRNTRLAAIKTFFRYLAWRDPALLHHCEQICAIKAKRSQSKPVEPLSIDEVAALINTPDSSTLLGSRDRALLIILYSTGARVSELIGLQMSDLQLSGAPQVTLLGKGNKQRSVPLRDDACELLQAYLQCRAEAGWTGPYVFLNRAGEPLSRFGVNYLVKKHRQSAEASCPSLVGKTISPHTFRHTTALHLIQSGVDLTTTQAYLGHADPATTAQYVQIDMCMKRDAIEGCGRPKYLPAPDASGSIWEDAQAMAYLEGLIKEQVALCRARRPANKRMKPKATADCT